MKHWSAWIGTAVLAAGVAASAQADPDGAPIDFAIMRNGAQIGTDKIRFGHDGAETTVENDTHVAVGLAMLILYRYDQSENERWADGRLVALNAKTNDNGKEHHITANAKDGKLVIRTDDKMTEAPPTAVPLSLWNPALVASGVALDPEDGTVQPIKVLDRGEERLLVQGKERPAHHYQIVTGFPQDVWYDDNNQLVQVELKGSDGSTIRYQLI
ncbi:MAG TPA: DUF6134 family protein [Rhizomicrobium sp.]|nr:DUF6134 family protein [Rhizomicrobium sp.]